MRVVIWPVLVASAGDGGGGEHSVGDDVRDPKVDARSVRTAGDVLRHGIVFELLFGA